MEKTEIEKTKIPPKEQEQVPSTCKPKIESTPIHFCKTPGDVPFTVRRAEGDTRNEIDLFNERLKELAGVKDHEIAMEILSTATSALITLEGTTSVHESFNYILQSLHSFKPQDAVEARLLAQAATLYKQGMSYLGKANKFDRVDFLEKHVNLGIKLLRTHNETIEALGKHRRGGKQTIVIQQQQVNLSGQAQAVVGNFSQDGGDTHKNEGETP